MPTRLMKRRSFIAALGGATVWPCIIALAQSAAKRPLIGYLGAPTQPASAHVIAAFLEGLHELGYVEGQNYAIAYRFADGHVERLPKLASELVQLNPDVIVAGGTISAVAVKQATPTTPIICTQISDAMRLSLADNYARPGGQITGLLVSVEGLPAKQLELALEAVPNAKTIGLLINVADTATGPVQRQEIEAAAQSLRIKILPTEVQSPDELEAAFKRLTSEGVQAAIVSRDSMFFSERRRIADLALVTRLPTVYPDREHVEAGGLVGYGVDIPANFRRAAAYVDKILKGAKPDSLPLEFATRLVLAINLRTAKALDLTVPPSLLARADEIIE